MRFSLISALLFVLGLLRSASSSSSSLTEERTPSPLPNIVFLVVESTDGRTWRKGYQNGVLDGLLPNIRKLEEQGTGFYLHYSNTPVCCPSRASFWSGRHAHKIKHFQKGSRIPVAGVWNNYEGLPPDYTQRMDQILSSKAGYEVKISGKEDWQAGKERFETITWHTCHELRLQHKLQTGSHSENVRLNSWTMYTRFPYNISRDGGWRDETNDCRNNGTVLAGNRSAHESDWEVARQTTAWIKDRLRGNNTETKPFFAYQGMMIVHPPYATSEEWYDKIDVSLVDVSLRRSESQASLCSSQIENDFETHAKTYIFTLLSLPRSLLYAPPRSTGAPMASSR